MQKAITTVTRIIKLTVREYYKQHNNFKKQIKWTNSSENVNNINTRRNKTSEQWYVNLKK